jgi:hypothetical protein
MPKNGRPLFRNVRTGASSARARNADIVAPKAPSPGRIAAAQSSMTAPRSVTTKSAARRSRAATSEPRLPPP